MRMGNDTGFEGLRARIRKRIDDIAAEASVQLREANKEVASEWVVIAATDISEAFTSAVESFYNDYRPRIYKRRGSMYRLLRINVDASAGTVSYDFDESAMTYRSGYGGEDGLYSDVFIGGRHGGADKIAAEKEAKWGAHPSPGTPYWRAGSHYERWGERATTALTAPYDAFLRTLSSYGDMWQKWYNDELRKRFYTRIRNSIAEVK